MCVWGGGGGGGGGGGVTNNECFIPNILVTILAQVTQVTQVIFLTTGSPS